MNMNYKSPRTKIIIFFLVLTVLFSYSSLYIDALGNVEAESKISQEIEYLYQTMDAESKVEVGIWLEGIPKQVLHEVTLTKMNISEKQYEEMKNSTIIDSGMQEYTSTYRDLAKKYYTTANKAFVNDNLNSNTEIIRMSSFLPVVIANMNYGQIIQIAQNEQVKEIMLYDANAIGEEIESPDTEHSLQSFDPSDLAHSTYTGEGVIIGILDAGMPATSTYNNERYDFTPRYTGANTYGSHADGIAQILLTLAPDAKYFCTSHYINDVYTSTFDEELEWLVDHDVNIITISMALSDNENTISPLWGTSYRFSDIYLDELAYNYSIVITKSSGNYGVNQVSSGAMGYNVITVAEYNETTLDMGDGAWNASGAYAAKPDIMSCSTSSSSYATPVVCGIIAQAMQRRPNLRYIPEDIRSILAATVDMSITHHYVPMQPRTTNSVGYNKYGAGLVCASNVIDAVSNYNFSLHSISSSETYDTRSITISNTTKPIRIAMSFLKGSNNLEDYDLTVKYGNSTVATSITTYNNVEIVEFTPSATGTYTIYMTRIGAATETETYISVAWYQE